ncbi:MAG: hypothetical protein JJT89_16720 [Nitriliruptoraceae bacterium]|nr:hypothetical protein [Nitriliruptoraceae bacterium]
MSDPEGPTRGHGDEDATVEEAVASAPLHVPPPYEGFDLQVMTDRTVYAPGETVRITVTAANQGPRFVEHRYPGWQRFVVQIRDERHRIVADDELERHADEPALDRFLPGQLVIWPSYWGQTAGPLVPAREGLDPGEPLPSGRYRIRVQWLGREPGVRSRPPEVDSPWFVLT